MAITLDTVSEYLRNIYVPAIQEHLNSRASNPFWRVWKDPCPPKMFLVMEMEDGTEIVEEVGEEGEAERTDRWLKEMLKNQRFGTFDIAAEGDYQSVPFRGIPIQFDRNALSNRIYYTTTTNTGGIALDIETRGR